MLTRSLGEHAVEDHRSGPGAQAALSAGDRVVEKETVL